LWSDTDPENVNIRTLNILGFAMLAITASAVAYGYVGTWAFVPLAIIYVAVLGWGVFDIGSQFFVRTVWKGPKGQIAFTFDDGPHPVHTPQILQLLDEEGVKAAFFCIGRHAERYPELVREIDARGHVVGNHTYLHTHRFGLMSAEQVCKEIRHGREAIARIIGRSPRMFRPPFGVINPKIAKAVEAERDVIIGWDLRSRDGVARSEKDILDRVIPRLRRSSLVLFHDTNPHTPGAVRKVIHLCRQNGTEIVSLPELTGVYPYRA
jgi:peptidoglycan-N-acetylglucosamine deacetylase